jgi:hypothetical protein
MTRTWHRRPRQAARVANTQARNHVITCCARNGACNKAQGTRRDFRNSLRRHARRVQACAQRKQHSGAQAQRNTSGAVDTSHAAHALTAPYVLATAPRGAGGPCNLGCERHRTRSKSEAAAPGPTLSNNTGQRGQEQQFSQSAHTDTTTRHAPRTHTHTHTCARAHVARHERALPRRPRDVAHSAELLVCARTRALRWRREVRRVPAGGRVEAPPAPARDSNAQALGTSAERAYGNPESSGARTRARARRRN